jgi:small basic protein
VNENAGDSPSAKASTFLKIMFGSSIFALFVSLVLGGLSSSGVPSMIATHTLFCVATLSAVIGVVTSELILQQNKAVIVLSGVFVLFIVGGCLLLLDQRLQTQRNQLDSLLTPPKPAPPSIPAHTPLKPPPAPEIVNSGKVTGEGNVVGNFVKGSGNVLGGNSVSSGKSGISIGRDNNGSATVNNFERPYRHLTDNQKKALQEIADSLPADSSFLHIEQVNDPETLKYGGEIAQFFKSKTNQIGVGLSYPTGMPEGVNVVIDSDKEPLYPVAQRIATAFYNSGIPVNFTRFANPRPGTIYIVIGVRPEH